MNYGAVVGLIQRRGQVIQWQHAKAEDPSTVDVLTMNPRLPIGAPRVDSGPFGEQYYDPAKVRALYTRKNIATFWAAYAAVNVGDAQLDLTAKFFPEPFYGIVALNQMLQTAWDSGDFAHFARGELIRRDRFVIFSERWVVKAKPVPLIDQGVILAWRVLIGKDEE